MAKSWQLRWLSGSAIESYMALLSAGASRRLQRWQSSLAASQPAFSSYQAAGARWPAGAASQHLRKSAAGPQSQWPGLCSRGCGSGQHRRKSWLASWQWQRRKSAAALYKAKIQRLSQLAGAIGQLIWRRHGESSESSENESWLSMASMAYQLNGQ